MTQTIEAPAVLWCEGGSSEPHERVTFTAGRCPLCHPVGRIPHTTLGQRLAGARLVHPEVHADVPILSDMPVEVWCDGTVRQRPPHARTAYTTTAKELVLERDQCPGCHQREQRKSGDTLAGAGWAHRLVHPADATVLVYARRMVEVWCDGAVQGHPAHERHTYTQRADTLAKGHNGCRLCPRVFGRRPRQTLSELPSAMARLDNTNDGVISSGTYRRVRVWCDGTVSGHAPHERIVYDQNAQSLAKGLNRCPRCGSKNRSNA